MPKLSDLNGYYFTCNCHQQMARPSVCLVKEAPLMPNTYKIV